MTHRLNASLIRQISDHAELRAPVGPSTKPREAMPEAQDPRRSSRRMRLPTRLLIRIPDTEDHREPLEVTLIMHEALTRVADCVVYDISKHGISFVTNADLGIAGEVSICVYHASDPSPVFTSPIRILYQRSFSETATLPVQFRDADNWIYGVRLDRKHVKTLLGAARTTLECIGAISN